MKKTYTPRDLWSAVLPSVPPLADEQWRLWEVMHEPDIIRQAILRTAVKNRQLDGNMNAAYLIKFCSSVMNRLEKGAVQHTTMPTEAQVEAPAITEEVNGNR